MHTLRTSRQKQFLHKVYLHSCTLWGHQGKLFCCKNITQILAHFDNGHQDSRWTKLYFQQLRFYSEIQIFLNLANEAILYFQRLREKYKKSWRRRTRLRRRSICICIFVFLFSTTKREIQKNLEGGQRGWGREVWGAVEERAEKDAGE